MSPSNNVSDECSLQFEERGLPFQTPAESGQAAIRTDYAMARHDDRDRIMAVGQANGSECIGAPICWAISP